MGNMGKDGLTVKVGNQYGQPIFGGTWISGETLDSTLLVNPVKTKKKSVVSLKAVSKVKVSIKMEKSV